MKTDKTKTPKSLEKDSRFHDLLNFQKEWLLPIEKNIQKFKDFSRENIHALLWEIIRRDNEYRLVWHEAISSLSDSPKHSYYGYQCHYKIHRPTEMFMGHNKICNFSFPDSLSHFHLYKDLIDPYNNQNILPLFLSNSFSSSRQNILIDFLNDNYILDKNKIKEMIENSEYNIIAPYSFPYIYFEIREKICHFFHQLLSSKYLNNYDLYEFCNYLTLLPICINNQNTTSPKIFLNQFKNGLYNKVYDYMFRSVVTNGSTYNSHYYQVLSYINFFSSLLETSLDKHIEKWVQKFEIILFEECVKSFSNILHYHSQRLTSNTTIATSRYVSIPKIVKLVTILNILDIRDSTIPGPKNKKWPSYLDSIALYNPKKYNKLIQLSAPDNQAKSFFNKTVAREKKKLIPFTQFLFQELSK